MKRLLLILILTFSFQSWTKADDIKDFEIEGISIGDSLLDYFSQEEINNFFIIEYPSSNRFVGWETSPSIKFKEYKTMAFHVKSDDNKYEIFSIKGMLDYPNNINECLVKKEEIIDTIKNHISYDDTYSYEDDFGNKIGKSIAYITDFDLSDGSAIRVWCSTWDKKNETAKYWTDTLNVGAGSKLWFDFLQNEAYK